MTILKPLQRFVNIFCKLLVIVLQSLERYVRKVVLPGSEAEAQMDWDTKQSNGSTLPVTPSVDSKPAKRIKLLVDINISPGGSSSVLRVATKDVMDSTSTPPSRVRELASQLALSILRVSGNLKIYLLGISTPSSPAEVQQSPVNASRKTRSPKRRVSQRMKQNSDSSTLGPKVNEVSNDIMVVPNGLLEVNGSTTPNRSQTTEKRKRSDDLSSDDEGSLIVDEDNADPIPKDHKSEVSEADIDTHESHESDNKSSTEGECDINTGSNEDSFGSPVSETHRLLDIAEEDTEYASAEDPDYEPDKSCNRESSSSSDEEYSEDVGCPADVEQELRDLREDALQFLMPVKPSENPEVLLNELNPVIPVPIDDAESNHVVGAENGGVFQANENDENHFNEPEYTNGQASMRELTERPLPPNFIGRRFYGSETPSTPFSVNASEPTSPTTPNKSDLDLGHDENSVEGSPLRHAY